MNPKLLGKVEDDIPALYKRLRYPFQISKSALFAVGSPHTWPGLLAALSWLAELLSYQEKAVCPCCLPVCRRGSARGTAVIPASSHQAFGSPEPACLRLCIMCMPLQLHTLSATAPLSLDR